jgi:hypothetical protein
MGRFAAGMRQRGAEQHLDDASRARPDRRSSFRPDGRLRPAPSGQSGGHDSHDLNIERPNGRAAAPSTTSSAHLAAAAMARVAHLVSGEDIVSNASLFEDILPWRAHCLIRPLRARAHRPRLAHQLRSPRRIIVLGGALPDAPYPTRIGASLRRGGPGRRLPSRAQSSPRL